MKIISKKISFLIVFTYLILTSTSLLSQQYVIQVGDKLNITFWQEPDLNTETIVSQDGTIELPVIGRIKAAGLTSSQLSERIIDLISRYRINITQASVVVTEYQGNRIYVTGQAGAPGAYSFEVIPSLWKVLQEAGGLLETADLEKITIIRAGEYAGNIIQVDLIKYFEKGKLNELPKLYGGDTVHVPSIPTIGLGVEPSSSPFLSKNEIYIVGEVVSPGRYNLEKDLNLLDVLILAGGPTPSAKLSDVKVIKRLEGNSSLMKINLQNYLNSSEPRPLLLHPGDTIYVPRKAGMVSFIFTRIFLPILISSTVAIIVFSIRR